MTKKEEESSKILFFCCLNIIETTFDSLLSTQFCSYSKYILSISISSLEEGNLI